MQNLHGKLATKVNVIGKPKLESVTRFSACAFPPSL